MPLRLDVGLPSSIALLGEHDLDNYLFPLVTRLGKRPGLSVVSVWATKQYAAESYIGAAPAVAVQAPSDGFGRQVRTTASASTTAYNVETANQLGDAAPLPRGPVALQLAFAVGTRRNWLNLWKPSIDALDRLLGRTIATRLWHPQDGRITELALHRTIDESLGNDVIINVVARSLGG